MYRKWLSKIFEIVFPQPLTGSSVYVVRVNVCVDGVSVSGGTWLVSGSFLAASLSISFPSSHHLTTVSLLGQPFFLSPSLFPPPSPVQRCVLSDPQASSLSLFRSSNPTTGQLPLLFGHPIPQLDSYTVEIFANSDRKH